MADMNWRDRISVNPEVCHGQACVRGTRVLVSVILDNLAEGETAESIIDQYPGVGPDDIRACLAYAADLAAGRHVDVPA
jgi:uncharacterized protein (DUF433 family)